MTLKISTLQMRQKMGDILNRVSLRHDHFIIERKGKALAAMVPIEMMDRIQQAAKLQLLEVLHRQKGALSQSEADALGNEAKHSGRRLKKKRVR